MVVLSTFNSCVRPVIPALRTTSLAIEITYAKAIIITYRCKSNANVTGRTERVLCSVFRELETNGRRDSRNTKHGTRSLLFNHRPELREQRRRIMRARRRLGVILHAENRLRLVMHALDGLVVQIDPVHRHVGGQ